LNLLYAGKQAEAIQLMKDEKWLKRQQGAWKVNIEGNEFAGKLERLGIELPWQEASVDIS
jgi:hypothetical protein